MSTSLATLQAVVRAQNFIILDTEITGLNQGEICQLAIIDHNGDVLLDTLVKPNNPIPPHATRNHGITNRDVQAAPNWAFLAPQIENILRGHDVITYNATYDRKMFHQSAEAMGMVKIDWKTISPWYCAMEAFAEFYGDWNAYHQSYRWKKLSVAADYCGVEVKDAHNALGDCLMTLGVINFITAWQQTV